MYVFQQKKKKRDQMWERNRQRFSTLPSPSLIYTVATNESIEKKATSERERERETVEIRPIQLENNENKKKSWVVEKKK